MKACPFACILPVFCELCGKSVKMRVAEIYRSVQGEGLLTGVPSVFVRASGCNLRCWFCDTPYTSWEPEGDDWSVEATVEEVERLRRCGKLPHVVDDPARANAAFSHATPIRHVVITGGEPMLFAEMIPLCQRLREI